MYYLSISQTVGLHNISDKSTNLIIQMACQNFMEKHGRQFQRTERP